MISPAHGTYGTNQGQFLSHFGSIPAHRPWSKTQHASSSGAPIDSRIDCMSAPTCMPATLRTSPPTLREPITSEFRSQHDPTPGPDRQDSNRKRAASRDFHRPYLKEMAAVHAENRDPNIQIPVSTSGTVLGLRSPWQRAARLCARQTINYKVRSYKAKREYWQSQVDCIAEKLAQKFTYTRPLDIKYLGRFLKNTLKNDRKSWKRYFFDIGGMRHHRCLVEAFTEWRKYWLSEAGKEESVQMREMRKGEKTRRLDDHDFTTETRHFAPPPHQVFLASL